MPLHPQAQQVVDAARPQDRSTNYTVSPAKPGRIRPAAVRIRPAAVRIRAAAVRIRPAAVRIRPAAARIRPAAARIRPAAVRIRPAAVRIRPAAIRIRPAAVRIRPAAIRIRPAAIRIRPAAIRIRAAAVRIRAAESKTAAGLYRRGASVASVANDGSAGSQAATQIRQLKAVAHGWHHDEPSVAPDPEGLEWLAARFEQDYPATAPPAHIFPDPEGTVTALWKISDQIQVEAEINLSHRTASLWIHCLSTRTAHYDVVDLQAPDALRDIGARNSKLAPPAR